MIKNEKQDFPCIMLAGDFNLPNITWEEGLGSLNSTPAYRQEFNSLYIEIMNDFGFKQLVNQPTRENHILNLVLSAQPDVTHNIYIIITVVPGISDHEAITKPK